MNDIKHYLDNPKALFAVNHSGGKDSQAMMIHLLGLGVRKQQMVVVHADLVEVEWAGAREHAEKQAKDAGVAFIVAKAFDIKGQPLDFFRLVERRHEARPDVPPWPSADCRTCTSDLKRGPIARELRRYSKQHGFTTVINCLGLRAEESPGRAAELPWTREKRNCTKTREWFQWLPIHTMTERQVFATIEAAKQNPHWAYGRGNERVSCMFCILGSKCDLRNAAKHNPALAAKFIEMEERMGYTMHQSRESLRQILNNPEAEKAAA